MNFRDDVELVNKAIANGWVTESQGACFLKQPLILIPKTDSNHTEEYSHLHRYAGRNLLQIAIYSKHLLREYVTLISGRYIYIKSDGVRLKEFSVLLPEIKTCITWSVNYDFRVDPPVVRINKPISTGRLPKYGRNNHLFEEDVLEWFVGMLKGVLGWVEYQHIKNRYAIGFKPTDNDCSEQYKRLLKLYGHKVIFLNKLPSVKSEDKEKQNKTYVSTIADPAVGHPRRSHYRVLKDECYKYHPRYLDPNGIFVRACWVGPIQTTYEGNVYTVLG